MNFNPQIQCQFCAEKAKLLTGSMGIPKWEGWTRYECRNGHRFAVPTHTVTLRRMAA